VSSVQNAVITRLVQGLLEWLPISSRGNLVLILMVLLGQDASQALSYSVYLHMGTGARAGLSLKWMNANKTHKNSDNN